jgi:valyl-tRNA synthetase
VTRPKPDPSPPPTRPQQQPPKHQPQNKHHLKGTAPGQDLNLSLDRVNAARNFTNKAWNVGKFIEFNLEKVDDATWAALAAVDYSSPAALASLPLPERWAVSGVHALAERVTAAHEAHDFTEAGQVTCAARAFLL